MTNVNTLASHILPPENIYFPISWNKLTTKSLTTLRWTMARAGVEYEAYKDGFNYDLLTKITLQDLHDTRNVGGKRAQELIDELAELYLKLSNRNENTFESHIEENSVLELALDTSINILAYISVEPNLNDYLSRIAKSTPMPEREMLEFIKTLNSQKSHRWFFQRTKVDAEEILFKLIQSQIRLPLAIARNCHPGLDLRAKILASNLGLIGAMKTFQIIDKSEFSNYATSIIEEFIDNLIFLGNMDYSTLENLLLGENLQISKSNSTELKWILQEDSNLAEILDFIDLKFIEEPNIDDRTLKILKERLPIFTNTPKTLEAIAKEWTVSRERIRQISSKWSKLRANNVPNLKALEDLTECALESITEDDFIGSSVEVQSAVEITVNANRLKAICEFFGKADLVEKITNKIQHWENADSLDSEFKNEIRKLRSPLGLYELSFLSNKFNVPHNDIESAIRGIYPRTIIFGDLVLARTKNLDSMIENSIAKQLLVAKSLPIDELIIGLERTASYRGVPLIGQKIDLRSLIIDLAGNFPSYEHIASNMLKPIALQRIEAWLVETFGEVNNSMLHSNELVSKALKDDINVSSLQVYLVNSPIIRSHSGAIYSLVGSEFDSASIDIYRKMVLATGKSSEINYEITGSNLTLKIRPNLNVITSGIIFPPSGLKNMVAGYIFVTKCNCNKLESRQQVKFSPSGFWTGFTAMIRHGMSVHEMNKDSEFIFEFDFNERLVFLKPTVNF